MFKKPSQFKPSLRRWGTSELTSLRNGIPQTSPTEPIDLRLKGRFLLVLNFRKYELQLWFTLSLQADERKSGVRA